MITSDEYKRHLAGFNVLGCTIRSKDVFCFLAQEDYTQDKHWNESRDAPATTDLEKRLVIFIQNKPKGERWHSAKLRGFEIAEIGFEPSPKPHVVVGDLRGQLYICGSGDSFLEKIFSVADGGPKRGAITKLKTIGRELFACGTGRTVAKRTEKNGWIGFHGSIPETLEVIGDGFDDIDGFSSGELYAAGGNGDVWRFDDGQWQQCLFPSESRLTAVCCGQDGYVYVGGLQGNIWKGRKDSWRLINEGELSLPFKDMVWYEGALWCTNDYGLWTLSTRGFAEAPVPSTVKVRSGNLCSRDDMLLVAGFGGAAVFEAKEWRIVF